jgi:hypothetical protein
MKLPPVIVATVRLGFPASTIVGIGSALLISTALYVIPPTSVLGAIMLTGYLGGATAANVRVGSGPFNTCFPIICGVFVWLGLYFRDIRLHSLIPIRVP